MSISDLIPLPSSSPSLRRRSFSILEALVIHLILSCTWLCNGTFEPYNTNWMPVNVDYNSYYIYEDAFNESVAEPFTSHLDPQCLNVNQMSYLTVRNTCYRFNLFCSRLQSPSLLSEEHPREAISRSPDLGSISKGIEEEQPESQVSDKISLDTSSFSLPVLLGVNPHLLDWGNGYLYSPKLAFLTLTNRQRDNVLHIFKPSRTDRQFYVCNYSGSVLDAGEVVSICFVFHPKQLGLLSAQLVIQTSIGGLVVQCKGVAVSNPVEDEFTKMSRTSSSGWWGKTISMFSSIGMAVYAMEFSSSLPGFMSSLFRKVLRGVSVKKTYAVPFFVVSLMFLRHCLTAPRIMQWTSKFHVFLGSIISTPTLSSVENSASINQNKEISGHSLKKKSRSVVIDCNDSSEHSVDATTQNIVSQCAKLEAVIHSVDDVSRETQKQDSVTSPMTKSVAVLNTDNENSVDGTVAVKVGKEKRRRKKRKGKGKGSRAGVAVSVESPGTGSQSGYSTPPTPMSPVTTVLLPNQSTYYATLETHKDFRSPINTLTSHFLEKPAVIEKSPKANEMKLTGTKKVLADTPKQTHNEPVLCSSASFPAAEQPAQKLCPPYILPPSSIAQHARAPGPTLFKKTCYQASEKVAVVKREAVSDFNYNIWGDYLFGFDRISKPKEQSVISLGNDSDSFSFFAKGPALLEKENFPRYVSPFDPKDHRWVIVGRGVSNSTVSAASVIVQLNAVR